MCSDVVDVTSYFWVVVRMESEVGDEEKSEALGAWVVSVVGVGT